MKFSIRYSDQIVGTLVILGLAILIFTIFMLGKSQRWFVKDYQYKTYFSSAQGLSQNMAIQYKGFTIGHVKKISLAEDNKVEVLFTIFEEHVQRVRVGSLVEAQISPLGLGNTFLFHPGLGEDLLPEGSVIPEVNSIEAKFIITTGLASRPDSTTDDINVILNQARLLLENLNTALSGTDNARALPLGQIIENVERATAGLAVIADDLSVQLNPILDNIEVVTDRMSDPQGTLMAFLDSNGLFYSSLEQVLASLAGVIDSLDKTAEFLPSQLPQIAVLVSQLNVTLNSVQDVLTAIANNPLLRGGIPEHREGGPGGAGPRDMEF
ncbi:MAG: MlaD family protein [Treponema sp.]|nr:MlaD family protein [Treponema sp.]